MNESLNSQEKEVLRQRVAAEKKTLTRLEAYYEEALREIDDHIALLMGRSDANLPNVINHIEYQRMIKAQVQASLDKLQAKEYESIEAYLEDSYTDAFVGTMYSLHAQGVPIITPIDQAVVIKAISMDTKLKDTLYNTLGMDLTKLKKTITSEITRGIASGMQYSEIQRNLSNATGMPLSRARLITRTEAGRVQEAATMDAAYKAMEKGADVVKQWCAVLDSKTRYHHMLLDKQTRELKEPFTIGSKKAMQPHDFGDPAEDCNCRCTVLIRARAALDADELKAMQERASYYGLTVKDSKAFGHAKAKDFSDFKKKYLLAAESVDNSGKNGIIEAKITSIKDAVSSGAVTTKINAEKQGRHIRTSPAYINGRSYISGTMEDAQRLVDDLSGTGVPLVDANGNWLNKERVQADHVFGVHVDPETGNETETTKGMIIYSKSGTHIIPRKEDGK